MLKHVCEFTLKDLEKVADVNEKFMKIKPKDFDDVALNVSNSLNLEAHEVIFFKSTIKNKLFKKGEILFRVGDDVQDIETFSPISGRDVDKFLIYGPSDKAIRKKIALQISKRFDVDLSKMAPM